MPSKKYAQIRAKKARKKIPQIRSKKAPNTTLKNYAKKKLKPK